MQRQDTATRRRTRARHRRYSPARLYVWCALLLIFSFGMALNGMHEAFTGHDYVWFSFFSLAALINIALYFWVVHWWLKWRDLFG